jgi:threonylcarbamoyladenosine tRNA methylthiotransferase MtaB
MRRRYQKELYADRINHIKALMPDCCIGVDVIVGFPGETEKDFLETCDFLKQLDISYLHVFTYSERENTLAAEMDDAVPMGVRKQRNKILRMLSEKKLRAFYESQIGKEQEVLFETDNKDGFMHGFTRNYIKVRTDYNRELINQIVNCRIEFITIDCEAVVTINSYAAVI